MNAVRIASVDPPFSTMTGLNFVAAVDGEDLLPVLNTEQPLPPTPVFQEQGPQRPGTVVRIEPRRNEEPDPATHFLANT